MLRRDALRKAGLPQIAAETIREVRHEAGESSQRTRTWCRTGDALRTRTSGTVMVSDLETPKKNDGSSWRASTRKPTGLSNARKTKRDPLKPSHNLGRRGSQRAILQHTHTRYERGGTAHMFTLFRPAPGERRATGVRSAPSAVVHPWLIEHLSEILAEIEKKHPQACLPREEDRPVCARWETWPGHPRQCPGPSLRIVLVLDTLAGHRSYDLGRWFVDQGVMPLCTPIGGSWLNMAESVHRLLVPRALAGQHPKNPQESSDW
jgi:hypothetical protein